MLYLCSICKIKGSCLRDMPVSHNIVKFVNRVTFAMLLPYHNIWCTMVWFFEHVLLWSSMGESPGGWILLQPTVHGDPVNGALHILKTFNSLFHYQWLCFPCNVSHMWGKCVTYWLKLHSYTETVWPRLNTHRGTLNLCPFINACEKYPTCGIASYQANIFD